MKSEWLKDLKEQAQFDDPAGYVGEPNRIEWYLPTGSLRALVTEREALLDALRDLVNWENGVQDAKDWRRFYAAAQAAIAKAEAP